MTHIFIPPPLPPGVVIWSRKCGECTPAKAAIDSRIIPQSCFTPSHITQLSTGRGGHGTATATQY